jgi:hypothetical protein
MAMIREPTVWKRSPNTWKTGPMKKTAVRPIRRWAVSTGRGDQAAWAVGDRRDLEVDGAESGIGSPDGMLEQVGCGGWQGDRWDWAKPIDLIRFDRPSP